MTAEVGYRIPEVEAVARDLDVDEECREAFRFWATEYCRQNHVYDIPFYEWSRIGIGFCWGWRAARGEYE